MPGKEPSSRLSQQRDINRAQPPMAKAGNQRQRYGVGDIGADNVPRRQVRVEKSQRGHTQRPGADRSNCDQHANHSTDHKRQARDMALRKVGTGATAPGQCQKSLAEDQ